MGIKWKGMFLVCRPSFIIVHSFQRINSCVRRRFKEFEVFYDLLVSRFPYRLVPKLPNKKIGGVLCVCPNCYTLKPQSSSSLKLSTMQYSQNRGGRT